ncbi:MAG: class I SAM-dependent methyltransferase [Firmicutes bacterium]|nr:class I SAM-dependent methyltransferase [Bacillota bacterium]
MFARAYDLLMADVDYEAIYQWLKPYIKKDQTIIDAGCGSGYLLLELLKNGYQAIGIDHDTEMLSLAQNRLQENELNPMLYEHDLRDSLGVKVDVVLAMFDVVNYFKGIHSVFKHIYQALNKQGLFIFDIYKEEVFKLYDNYTEIDDEPIHYEWYVKTKNHQLFHTVKIEDEVEKIKQYVYPISYYQEALESLGFKVEVKDGVDERKHYIIAYK